MTDTEDKGVVVNFLAGIGVGAIIGAAAALLLAPKTGEETRDDLRKAVQDLSKSTEELRKRSSELVDTAKTKVQQAYDAGRDAVQKRRATEESGETAPEG